MEAAKVIDLSEVRERVKAAAKVKVLTKSSAVEVFHEARSLYKIVKKLDDQAKAFVIAMGCEAGEYEDVGVELKITTSTFTKPSVDLDTLMSVLSPSEIKKLEDAGAFKYRKDQQSYSTVKI